MVLISNEQVYVLVARDGDKMTVSQVLGMGILTIEQLDKATGHKLPSDIMCAILGVPLKLTLQLD